MRISWHIFRQPTITEAHVAHAPASHTSGSEIARVLEWVIPFKQMFVGVVCENWSLGSLIARFLLAHIPTSRLVYLSQTAPPLEDVPSEKRPSFQAVVCSTKEPPLRPGSLETLILLDLGGNLPADPAKALEIASERLIIAVDHKQYLAHVSSFVSRAEQEGVGYVGRNWVLLLLKKRQAA